MAMLLSIFLASNFKTYSNNSLYRQNVMFTIYSWGNIKSTIIILHLFSTICHLKQNLQPFLAQIPLALSNII